MKEKSIRKDLVDRKTVYIMQYECTTWFFATRKEFNTIDSAVLDFLINAEDYHIENNTLDKNDFFECTNDFIRFKIPVSIPTIRNSLNRLKKYNIIETKVVNHITKIKLNSENILFINSEYKNYLNKIKKEGVMYEEDFAYKNTLLDKIITEFSDKIMDKLNYK